MTAAKRRRTEALWGAELWDCFGMTEAGMMGSESAAHDGFHIWTDMYKTEVLDEVSGEPVPEGVPGALVVTPLWTNNATPFLRWNSGDIVTWRRAGASSGPFGVFPIVKHTHRIAGFFKIRGVNMNHTEFEDFMFANDAVADFRVELTGDGGLEALTVGIEVRDVNASAEIAEALQRDIRTAFEVSAEIDLLPRGTFASEFEQSVKAQRFVDKRR